MSANDDIQQKLRQGVEAAKRGDRVTARRLLEQVVQVDDNNELAWMWLASAVNTVAERRACLERVLQINPKNERATEALRRLESTTSTTTEDELRARQTIEQFRQAQRQTTRQESAAASEQGGGLAINTSTLILIGLVLAVIIGAGAIASVVSNLNSQPTATPTVVAQAATETPEFTETPAPTATGLSIDQITRSAPTLPPTLTPSRTPSETPTLEPTAEPTPLGLFEVLYASLNSGAEEPDLYFLQGDGTGEGFMVGAVRDMSYAPDGERIAFIRDVPGGEDGSPVPEVFVTTFSDITNATQITSLGAPDTRSPSWSPDGSQIVFSSSNGNESEELWVIDADGQNLTRLTENEFVDRDPSWSPVENIIAFTSDRDSPGFTEIYSMTLPDGEGDVVITRLTDAGNNSYSPSWSDDGTQIVFASDRGGFSDIYTMDKSGENEVLITSDDGNAENREPDFSPDARWIAFVSNREGFFQTYVTNSTGTEVIRISNNEREDFSVIFRPLPRDE